MKFVVILCAGLAAVLLYLLSTASANTALFARNYRLILGLNGALLLVLSAALFYQLRELRRKLRAKVFGARLTLRLVLMFALMAILPGAVLYGVSVQFLAKSIESWFDVRVDKALEGGLGLGRATLESMLKDLNRKAENTALSLAEHSAADALPQLNLLREQGGVQEATLFNSRGRIIVFSGSGAGLLPELPDPAVLRQARMQRSYSAIESVPEKGIVLRVIVPVNVLSLSEDIRLLQLLQTVPRQLAQDLEIVQAGYQDYQELSLLRVDLKRLYGVTLTLSLLLALLSALALAVLLSERLSAPLSILAEGTRAVASGDFSQRHPVQSSDELGVLTQSFNLMTHQLAEAQAVALRHQAQLESAMLHLESILANLSSGVLALDHDLSLRSANPRSGQILGAELRELEGQPLGRWDERVPDLGPFSRELKEALKGANSGDWQREIERTARGRLQVLLVRGTRLPEAAGQGYVVVFDDVTDLIQAQREAAWGEVARRLAHEIKNPLTPIQLSAERLQRKLADRLSGEEAEVLKRASDTIVGQVTAMKSMVDAFSQYARSPELKLQPLDLNQVVTGVLALYEAEGPRVSLKLASGLPPVQGDPARLGQVIHNLLQNAQDALAETPDPWVEVRTEAADQAVCLTVSDNGAGFPDHLLPRAFEPYVTTKAKGTGLGLAIVRKIVEEHEGAIRIENGAPRGTRVVITLPTKRET
ncbi:MAG: HAMP domain-containing protein [Betaproteobacteria bacterium]|nr:HAMP domain-containing protein [Betaproteobacteria bacterium]